MMIKNIKLKMKIKNPSILFIINFLLSVNIIILISLNKAFATTSYIYTYNDIVNGSNEFIKKEIFKQHKTVDLDSIAIKILNPQTISDKICYSKVMYHFPIHSSIHQKATIIAECRDPNSWKVYIPVNIKFLADVISVKKSLPKLHVINREDLTLKRINVITLRNSYYADLNEVVGLVLKTSVKQDTVLTSDLLKKVNNGT